MSMQSCGACRTMLQHYRDLCKEVSKRPHLPSMMLIAMAFVITAGGNEYTERGPPIWEELHSGAATCNHKDTACQCRPTTRELESAS